MIDNKLLKNYNIGLDFINFFYNCWINNSELLNNNIKDFTKFSYKSLCYEGKEIINLLNFIKYNNNNKIYFSEYSYEILDSNSRQLYILVSGKINNNNFTQTFNLLLIKNNIWIILNSLLIII